MFERNSLLGVALNIYIIQVSGVEKLRLISILFKGKYVKVKSFNLFVDKKL